MNDQEKREVNELTTPSGKKLEMKTYLTARERNQIRDVFLSTMKIDPVTNKTSELNGSAMGQAQDDLIKIAVVSFDGSIENILDRVLDGTPGDYGFILEEANKIQNGNLNLAK